MILGLVPDCDLGRVAAVGNAAGDGALIMLLDSEKRLEAAAVAATVEHIQTATEAEFQDEFVGAIHLPHMSDPFPHLAPILNAAAAVRVVDPASASAARGRGARRDHGAQQVASP
jgi:uncharacterized 2Fe-2S/4Fe-4S cluster protein (DUF4445 family)